MRQSTATTTSPGRTQLLGVAEVARQLGVHRNTVKRWSAEGDLPSVKIKGSRRFKAADVEALIQRGEGRR